KSHSAAMSREPLNIVVLGGSFAGLSAAHHFLDHVIQQLRTFESAPRYRVVLVSPSTHLYWNICAPRALVSAGLIPVESAFVPIEPGFSRHPFNEFTYMQGAATAIDTSARTVAVVLASEATTQHSTLQTLPYHALILATGSSAYSPLYSLHGAYEKTIAELRSFHTRLETARSVLIVGGGPSSVETAGQLATYFNRRSRWPFNRKPAQGKPPSESKRSGRLLPKHPPSIGHKASKKLKNLGVHVVHSIRQVGSSENPDGSTNCHLNNDMTITADVLIAATGVYPNTSYLPAAMLDEAGYVVADPEDLRVYGPGVGERMYAVGDCASYSKNCVLDVYDAVPVLMHNLRNDLLAYEVELGRRIAELRDMRFVQNQTDTQLMPITRWGGVGVVFDIAIPSLFVHWWKGRDYRVGRAQGVVKLGKNPYQ
ncbi:FAD/NAD(P)-binding domain-containing protein, partial [Cenococcum geophilum 1.58]|uniref:FAD/NAD(P)-binding domain-containing protein n=1 Tax=Cenococcum geophilum 1.58 TaxID=794803 RepID=UPI00358FF6AD